MKQNGKVGNLILQEGNEPFSSLSSCSLFLLSKRIDIYSHWKSSNLVRKTKVEHGNLMWQTAGKEGVRGENQIQSMESR